MKHLDHSDDVPPAPAPEAPARVKLQLIVREETPPPASTHAAASRFALAVAESLIILVAAVIADVAYHAFVLGNPGHRLASVAVGLLTAALFAGAIKSVETNQRLRDPSSIEALRDLTFVWIGTILSVTFFSFALKADEMLSRGAMMSFMALGYVGLVVVRVTLPRLFAKHVATRINGDEVIVIGVENDPPTVALLRELEGAGYSAPQLVLFRADCAPHEWPNELRRSMDKVMALAHAGGQGEICIAGGAFGERRLYEVLAGLKVIPRAVRVIPSPAVEQFLHYPVRGIGSLYSVELQRAPMDLGQLTAKRILDLAAAAAILILIAPLLLLIALAIKLDSKGPILFRQRRLGLRGKAFEIFKFRTMTVTENGDVVTQAQKNDPRVTRVGRWLRRFSLDEFPQLLNVIRGEMSLVGPRPHALAHDRYYGALIENYEVRQHVKPGMTGWAQVNGLRGETKELEQMRRRVEADVWYAKNASVSLDLKILLLTFVEVFRQRNAH
jgi:Undecaprenyl-phosphate glucose phosphotransferase